MSPFSARAAEELGYKNIKVFQAGIPAWKKSKSLMISTPNGLKKMISENEAYVLIDLRAKDVATEGHIKDAVSIPLAELAASQEMFPKKKTAPIILYNDKQASAAAFATVRSWGYKNTTVLQGGADQWTGKFFSGAPADKIIYVKKLKPGQISIAEFNKIVAEKPANQIILDVRDGSVAGVIPGSIAIPQPQLSTRLGELSKDKDIIIHCNTGIMASMALKTLAANDFQARYLDAVVQVNQDGSYGITEK